MPRAILVVKHRLPVPVEIGSDAISYGLLRTLKDAFAITFVAVDDGLRAERGAEELRAMGIEVILARRERNIATESTLLGSTVRNARLLLRGLPRNLQSQECPSLRPVLDELTARTTFGLAQFEAWDTARYRRFAHCPAALLNYDAWFRTVEGFARYDRSLLRTLFWRLESRAVKRHELAAQADFEWRLFLSEEDRQLMNGSREGQDRMAVLPVAFPFEPLDPEVAEPHRSAPVVLFVGAMNVPFNIDAVGHFAREVWPTIRKEVPEAAFLIAGREPTRAVQDLASHAGIRVVGYVPDLSALLRQARVAVSPSRIGTGIKVKVAQAMAAGLPTVGTSVGLSGFGQAKCLVRADDERGFAQQVIRLLRDSSHRRQVGRACYEFYREDLWLEAVRPRVIAFYDQLLECRRNENSALLSSSSASESGAPGPPQTSARADW